MYLFIFRRDLRLVDNKGINYLIENKIQFHPIFIMDPIQINKELNPYFSHRSVQFLHESLKDLDREIKKNNKNGLKIFYGNTLEVIKDILTNNKISGICFNEDYTPYSVKRDNDIKNICLKYSIKCNTQPDICLYDFKKIKTKSNKPYKRFKWFYITTKKMNVENPVNLTNHINISNSEIISSFTSNLNLMSSKYTHSANAIVFGGRKNGLQIMKKNVSSLRNYKAVRQVPLIIGKPTSTLLSAYNKYGCISIRELYHLVNKLYGKEHEIIRQLVWRDFYYNIVFFYPEIFILNKHSYSEKMIWNENKIQFKAWCEGKTGFPFIDSSMRQLNKEGYMSNRGRLACSSFLIKNLQIDWKKGEKYFANKLIDYDPSQNNGNWQWVSSTGFESQAYFRFINPEKDLLNFDPKCVYVKKYIDELKDVDYQDILSGNINKYTSYPSPIIDIKNSFEEYKNKVKYLL